VVIWARLATLPQCVGCHSSLYGVACWTRFENTGTCCTPCTTVPREPFLWNKSTTLQLLLAWLLKSRMRGRPFSVYLTWVHSFEIVWVLYFHVYGIWGLCSAGPNHANPA
jgi:hypothetical protein